jgi:uncharacterized membrane protein YfcA
MSGLEWWLAGGAVVLASALQTATGAGLGLVAGPALVLAMGSGVAVQVAIVLNLALSVALLPGEVHHVDRRALVRLCVSGAAGIPLGVLLVRGVEPTTLKLVAAVAVVVAACQLMLGARALPAPGRRGRTWAAGAGVISGAMSSGLAMPGPAALWALWVDGLAVSAIRATLRALFVFSYGAALALHALLGIPWESVLNASLILAPALAGGALAGLVAKRRLSDARLKAVLIGLVLATGLSLLGDTVLEVMTRD